MKRRRICIVKQGYYPGDVRVRREAEALIDQGCEVDIICLRGPLEEKRQTLNGVNIYRIPFNRLRGGVTAYLFEYLFFFLLATIKMSALYLHKKYDMVQVNTLPDFLVFAALLPKLFGAGVLLDLHEPAPELFIAKFGLQNRSLLRIVKFAEKLSIAYANRAVTVSEQMKNNYVKRGADLLKIDVILNLPDCKRFDPDLYRRNADPCEKKKFIMSSHGAIMKRYGLELAIRGTAILKDEIPDIQLNILGYGHPDYIKELRGLAAAYHLDDCVRFLGYRPFDEMIAYLMNSDAGIVPVERNPYSDLVHTNKMFEYVAMKIPVIISRTKAVEEFWGDHDACVKYFNSGDAHDFARCVIDLYKDPELGRKIAENAYERYRSISWDVAKKTYGDIVNNCIKMRSKAFM